MELLNFFMEKKMQKKVLLSLAVLSVSTIALAEDSSLKSLSTE